MSNTDVYNPSKESGNSGYIIFISYERLIGILKDSCEFKRTNTVLKIRATPLGLEFVMKNFDP